MVLQPRFATPASNPLSTHPLVCLDSADDAAICHAVHGGRGCRQTHAHHDCGPKPLPGGPPQPPGPTCNDPAIPERHGRQPPWRRRQRRQRQRRRWSQTRCYRGLDGVGVVAGANATPTTTAEAPSRAQARRRARCHNVELHEGRGCRACLGGPGQALGGWGHAACWSAQSRILGQHPRAARCTRHSVASNVPADPDDALISDFTVCTVPVPM